MCLRCCASFLLLHIGAAFLVPTPPTAGIIRRGVLAIAARGGTGTRNVCARECLRPRGRSTLLASSPAEAHDKVQEAITKCRYAVERKPENEEAWFLLGVLLQETGELDGARTAFEKSTVMTPYIARKNRTARYAESLFLVEPHLTFSMYAGPRPEARGRLAQPWAAGSTTARHPISPPRVHGSSPGKSFQR